jgi:hypothetical protein
MIDSRLLPLTVTWQQPGIAAGDYGGDEQDDWSDGARTDTTISAYIEQRDTLELVTGRATVVSRLVLICNELDLAAEDRIVSSGKTYAIDGDPAVLLTPNGPHHTESTLKLVTG